MQNQFFQNLVILFQGLIILLNSICKQFYLIICFIKQTSQYKNNQEARLIIMHQQISELIQPNTQTLIKKHKQNYQGYLNNIYETIKEKQFYIHRSHTPNFHSSVAKNNSSHRSQKNQQDNLKSLPKLATKDIVADQLFYPSRQNNLCKKPSSSPDKQQPKNFQVDKNSNSKNFLSKRKKKDELKQKQAQKDFDFNIVINSLKKDKRVISSPNKNLRNIQQQRKISKQNMNFLGLNVEKINYKDKQERDIKKFMCIRVCRPDNEQSQQDQTQRNTIFQNDQNEECVYDSKQGTLDMDFCEEIISQKIKFSKRQVALLKKPSDLPFTGKKRLSSAVNKSPIISQVQQVNPIYQGRFKRYLDFLLKVSYSYGIYGHNEGSNPQSYGLLKSEKKYKCWIGNGNNGNLLKSLMKRRFWWIILEQKNWNANFIWTQLKNNEYFKMQNSYGQSQKKQKSTLQSLTLLSSHTQSNENINVISSKASGLRSKSSIINKKKSSLNSPHKDQRVFKKLQILLTKQQRHKFKNQFSKILNKTYLQKVKALDLKKIKSSDCRVHNHLMNNFYLGNKKALFYNLKEYYELTGGDVFKTVPLTFHIKKGLKDPQYKRFIAYHKRRQQYIKKQQKQMQKNPQIKQKMRNIWIVKPGENTNRGNGITVIDQIYQLNSIIKSEGTHNDGSPKTFIVQLYIDRPLLYKKRKFDIRHYMLITHINGIMKGYWFKQGYIRTTSYQFNIQQFQREIHLTNDAVQKYTPLYGKYQAGNKLSYGQFQKYLDSTYPKKNYSFNDLILPRMKEICIDAIKSSFMKLSPNKLQHNFQLFGMDFMIDHQFVPWLIQINTNPCLQLSCPLLERLIPQVLDQTLRLTLDVIYPPPCHYPNTSKHLVPETDLNNLKCQILFDERIDGVDVRKIYEKRGGNNKLLQQIGQVQDDEVFQDDGKMLKIQDL